MSAGRKLKRAWRKQGRTDGTPLKRFARASGIDEATAALARVWLANKQKRSNAT